MVEIARAVLHNAKVIIFDEPTASLTPEEKKYFFDLIANLKKRGVSVIFISHALEEALLVSDRITILRDGKHVVTDETRSFDRARIVQAMVGRDLSQTLYGQRKTSVRPQGKRVLSVQNLRMAAMVKNNSLSVFAGQITGVFGLVGSGRTETFKVVAGVIKRDFMHGGEVLLNGRPVRYFVPRLGGARRHRLRHRRAQDRGLLRDPVDRRQHLPRPAGQAARPAHAGVQEGSCEVGEHWIKRSTSARSARTSRRSSFRAATSRRS